LGGEQDGSFKKLSNKQQKSGPANNVRFGNLILKKCARDGVRPARSNHGECPEPS
jgi:hypothetical protein